MTIFEKCQANLLRIHREIDAGRAEGDAIDRLRDDGADMWHELSADQQDTLRALAAELNKTHAHAD